jgi:hypothetical protein
MPHLVVQLLAILAMLGLCCLEVLSQLVNRRGLLQREGAAQWEVS